MSILEYFNQTFKNGAKVYSFFSQVNEMTSLFNEKAKINKLHSSSLAALMCFYKVSKEQPLNIRINDINFEFTEVKFEHENNLSFAAFCTKKS